MWGQGAACLWFVAATGLEIGEGFLLILLDHPLQHWDPQRPRARVSTPPLKEMWVWFLLEFVKKWTDGHGGLYGVTSLSALTQGKYTIISAIAREVGVSTSVYSDVRAVRLELFFLIVPEQGSPSESKSSLSFVTANFAPGLSTSLALMLHFGALCSLVLPSSVSPRRGQLERDSGL